MSQTEITAEKRVYKESDPDLHEEIESTMFSGGTEIILGGQRFNVARDRDEEDKAYFVLTPAR